MTIKWTKKNPMERHIPLTLSAAKLKKKEKCVMFLSWDPVREEVGLMHNIVSSTSLISVLAGF